MAVSHFSVFNWNVYKNISAEGRKSAMKNELREVRSLVLLQEIPFQLDGKVVRQYISNFASYVGVHTEEATSKRSCGILYDRHKFEERPWRGYLTEAYYRVQTKLDCFAALQEGTVADEEIVAHITGKYTEDRMKEAAKEIGYFEDIGCIAGRISSHVHEVADQLSTDPDMRFKTNVLKDCCEGIGEFWNTLLKDLSYRFALTMLRDKSDVGGSIVTVSFHNRKEEPEKMLHAFLYLLAELRQVMKARNPSDRFPILLAGDFNMDVFSYNPPARKWGVSDYLLEPYNPQPYPLTACRKDRIDHIMLWEDDGDVTCTLGEVRAHVIDLPPDINVHEPDCDLAWRLAGPWYESDEAWRDLLLRHTFHKLVSNHDPLTTTLTMERRVAVKKDQEVPYD